MWRSALASIACIVLLSPNAYSSTIYKISLDPRDTRTLTVSVVRPDSKIQTALVYKGFAIGEGIKPQIENVTCDGRPLKLTVTPYRWAVPPGCKKVRWQVHFDPPGMGDASTQRSVASLDNSFRLFSQASSLAMLGNAEQPSLLSVPPATNGLTIPTPRRDGTLVLPSAGQPPLFLLLGSKPIATAESGSLVVRYFVDDRSHAERLVPFQTVLGGLQWLNGLMPKARVTDLNYVWLGLPSSAVSLGGATGSHLMMVNYIRDGSTNPEKSTILALAPLIEGAHYLSHPFGARDGWAEESLATYFGIEALCHARPNDDESRKLQQKFILDARHFPLKLIEAQRHVANGDRTAYPTYFTKGVAFWTAIDRAIKYRDPHGLAGKSKILWMMRFGVHGQPPANFAEALDLPEAKWRTLKREFLE